MHKKRERKLEETAILIRYFDAKVGEIIDSGRATSDADIRKAAIRLRYAGHDVIAPRGENLLGRLHDMVCGC